MRYPTKTAPNHPRANRSASTKTPWLCEHILIAERALGKYLPDDAEVHHVNGNERDSRNGNLVICQDRAYHKLLHVRTRIVRVGGDPNTQRICCRCRQLRPFAAFGRRSASKSGLQAACKSCMTGYRQDRKAAA